MLTTHRMDEAEALCDTIAIMINGKIVCLGSPGYLKQKYGQGYRLEIKLSPNSNLQVTEIDAMVTRAFPLCQRENDLRPDI